MQSQTQLQATVTRRLANLAESRKARASAFSGKLPDPTSIVTRMTGAARRGIGDARCDPGFPVISRRQVSHRVRQSASRGCLPTMTANAPASLLGAALRP